MYSDVNLQYQPIIHKQFLRAPPPGGTEKLQMVFVHVCNMFLLAFLSK